MWSILDLNSLKPCQMAILTNSIPQSCVWSSFGVWYRLQRRFTKNLIYPAILTTFCLGQYPFQWMRRWILDCCQVQPDMTTNLHIALSALIRNNKTFTHCQLGSLKIQFSEKKHKLPPLTFLSDDQKVLTEPNFLLFIFAKEFRLRLLVQVSQRRRSGMHFCW